MDARGWDNLHQDELGGVVRDVPHLEAEIRRKRVALQRIKDALSAARSWQELAAAVKMAKDLAEEELRPKA